MGPTAGVEAMMQRKIYAHAGNRLPIAQYVATSVRCAARSMKLIQKTKSFVQQGFYNCDSRFPYKHVAESETSD